MRFVLLTLLTLAAQSVLLEELLAQTPHDDLKGFWSNGDARNWDRPVTPNTSQKVSYRNYPLVVDRLKADEDAAKTAPIIPTQNLLLPQDLQQMAPASEFTSQPPPVSTPLTREQIVAKFGSPDQPQLIRAQKDSPPAMQGLFEALNSNDKELAWQYAVALARRQLEMQSVVSKATDYQMLAMEALGLRAAAPPRPDGDPTNMVRDEVRDLMARTRQVELAKQMPLPSSYDAQEALLAGDGAATGQATTTSQMATAVRRPPQIPIDPEGKVKLLIFMDEKLPESKELAQKIAPLREKVKGDTHFSVVGLTKRTYNLAGLKLQGAELSFPFPLLSGEALALDLRIQSYPTFLFVAVTSRETFRIEGIPALEEIEKTVKAMRGGR